MEELARHLLMLEHKMSLGGEAAEKILGEFNESSRIIGSFSSLASANYDSHLVRCRILVQYYKNVFHGGR